MHFLHVLNAILHITRVACINNGNQVRGGGGGHKCRGNAKDAQLALVTTIQGPDFDPPRLALHPQYSCHPKLGAGIRGGNIGTATGPEGICEAGAWGQGPKLGSAVCRKDLWTRWAGTTGGPVMAKDLDSLCRRGSLSNSAKWVLHP